MLKITATLKGESPISFSSVIVSPKKPKEKADVYEERTWRERMKVDDNGNVYMVQSSIKNCLSEAAKFLSEKIPGNGQQTYTKLFKTGILSTIPLTFNVKAKDVQGERLFVPSNGVAGGTKRVWKTFPIIPAGWECDIELLVFEETLIDKPEKVIEYLEQAGKYIGLGKYRPINNGWYGRFSVKKHKISNYNG